MFHPGMVCPQRSPAAGGTSQAEPVPVPGLALSERASRLGWPDGFWAPPRAAPPLREAHGFLAHKSNAGSDHPGDCIMVHSCSPALVINLGD